PLVNTCADICKDVVSVYTDPQSIAKVATDHFLERGLRSFAYVGWRYADPSQDMLRAWTEELALHKFRLASYETEKAFTGSYMDFASLDEVEPELVELIRKAKKPLALLAIHDRWAAAISRIASELGFAIPGDVAIVGVNDSDIARVSNPPISSVRVARERIGYE